jgi:hypothetical protein
MESEEGMALEKRFGEATRAARKLLVTISTGTSTTVVNGQVSESRCNCNRRRYPLAGGLPTPAKHFPRKHVS